MEHTLTPVILTGILEKDPEPFLTPERELGCALTVRRKNLFFVKNGSREQERDTYTVRVFSPLRDVLFAGAGKHCPVTVPGLLIPGTNGLTADIVYSTKL